MQNEHDIVQVQPDREMFGGCMVVVTEVKSWGIQGYVQSAGVAGQQYIRLETGEFAETGGKAVWGGAMTTIEELAATALLAFVVCSATGLVAGLFYTSIWG